MYEQPKPIRRKKAASDSVAVVIPLHREESDQRKQVAMYRQLGYETAGVDEDGGVILKAPATLKSELESEQHRVARERVRRPAPAGVPGQTEGFVEVRGRRYAEPVRSIVSNATAAATETREDD